LALSDEEFRFCTCGVCKWLVAADGVDTFCRACRVNWTIPDLDAAENLLLWQHMETASLQRADSGTATSDLRSEQRQTQQGPTRPLSLHWQLQVRFIQGLIHGTIESE
jgi:hypothetical protein